mgnify:CR=1
MTVLGGEKRLTERTRTREGDMPKWAKYRYQEPPQMACGHTANGLSDEGWLCTRCWFAQGYHPEAIRVAVVKSGAAVGGGLGGVL